MNWLLGLPRRRSPGSGYRLARCGIGGGAGNTPGGSLPADAMPCGGLRMATRIGQHVHTKQNYESNYSLAALGITLAHDSKGPRDAIMGDASPRRTDCPCRQAPS